MFVSTRKQQEYPTRQSFLTISSQPPHGLALVSKLLTVDLMATAVMAGVQKKPHELTTGCRLILGKHFKCALLLPRETEMAMNGQQTSSCLTHLTEIPGRVIKIQMAGKW